MQSDFKLKKPIIVYLLATAFLLSPIGNLSYALLQEGFAKWYSPALWAELFQNLRINEKVLISFLPVSGVLLFFQRKTSWFFAIVTLLLISIHNLVTGHYVYVLLNLPILVILFFFRFPYLDQRDHLFKGISQRFNTNFEPSIEPATFKGVMKNISLEGCFIQFQDYHPQKGEKIKIKLFDQLVEIECMHVKNSGCGFRFQDPKQITMDLIKKCQRL
jgi:hypothetical protein